MDNLSLNTIDYFQPSHGGFWKWVENGNVIEFSNGKTVCYREDLTFILESLTLPQPIPLGTFILLFCACKDNFESIYSVEAEFKYICLQPREETRNKNIYGLIRDAFAFLKVVNALPYKYRMGLKRIPL